MKSKINLPGFTGESSYPIQKAFLPGTHSPQLKDNNFVVMQRFTLPPGMGGKTLPSKLSVDAGDVATCAGECLEIYVACAEGAVLCGPFAGFCETACATALAGCLIGCLID